MNKGSKWWGYVSSRGIGRMIARILAIVTLTVGFYLILAGNFMQPVAFALQGTTTPAYTPTVTEGLHPSTTVTATPGLPVPPPGTRTYFSIALFVLLAAGLFASVLWIAFRRPGVWNSRNITYFSLGFAGWFVVNTLLWLWVNSSVARSSGTIFIHPAPAVPPLANILALLILLVSRRWMLILGLFSAITFNAIGTMLATPVTVTYQEDVILAIIGNVPFFLPPFLPALNFGP